MFFVFVSASLDLVHFSVKVDHSGGGGGRRLATGHERGRTVGPHAESWKDERKSQKCLVSHGTNKELFTKYTGHTQTHRHTLLRINYLVGHAVFSQTQKSPNQELIN